MEVKLQKSKEHIFFVNVVKWRILDAKAAAVVGGVGGLTCAVTRHAPHPPSPQEILVPVRCRLDRRYLARWMARWPGGWSGGQVGG